MNLKKIILAFIVLLVLLGCISSVNAGLFDFLLGEGMTNKNFESFTIDVPADVELANDTMPNAGNFNKLISKNGSSAFNASDPTLFHPQWKNDTKNFSIEYIDFAEDGKESLDNYVNITLIKEENGLKKYNMTLTYPEFDGEYYGVSKVNGDKSAVILKGNNLDLITKMAESIEFK